MSKPSKNTFDCKLNKHYYDALKTLKKGKKPQTPTITEMCVSLGISQSDFDCEPVFWKKQYEFEIEDEAAWEWEDISYERANMWCCGINELDFTGLLATKFNCSKKEQEHNVAKYIQKMWNKDKRVVIAGLPISKIGGGPSDYDFQQYQKLRRILLKFGFKQVSKRPYKNANSNNMLSVLVGQFAK